MGASGHKAARRSSSVAGTTSFAASRATAHLMMYWKSDSSPPAPTTHASFTLYSRSKDLYRLVLPYAPVWGRGASGLARQRSSGRDQLKKYDASHVAQHEQQAKDAPGSYRVCCGVLLSPSVSLASSTPSL